MSLSPGSRARKRKASDGDDSAPKPEDLDVLRDYLKKEEAELRDQAPAMLNNELVGRMDESKLLIAKLQLQPSFQEALDAGHVDEARRQLTACLYLGIRLEMWLSIFIPPLSAGGNMGISAEVQDGIFSHVHQLTTGSNDAIHHMLAMEKELAQMHTKCKDEVWARYRVVLERTMLHSISKAALDMQVQLSLIGGAILNNISHLRKGEEESKIITQMY